VKHWWDNGRRPPRGNTPTPARPLYRPTLECLEGRCLLSGGFLQTNLISDVSGLAAFTDPNLVNPWGISFSPTGPFWISAQGAGVSTIYDGDGFTIQSALTHTPLVVTTPGLGGWSGRPTGTAFNGGSGFVVSEGGRSGPARFLFASDNGTISGWNPDVDGTHALVAVDDSWGGADYKGLALYDEGTRLFATNFSAGTVDVFDQNFHPVYLDGAFKDPGIPDGFAPFGIWTSGDQVFVTYAKRSADWTDTVPGAGNGYLDAFDTSGHFLWRVAGGGVLNAPWGMAVAPAHFGEFSNDLLVGNNGDGRINAFDPNTGAFLGQLKDAAGRPITIENLWGLSFGNGGLAGDSNTLFFTAGIGGERHGLFGRLRPADQGSALQTRQLGPLGYGTVTPGGAVPDPLGTDAGYPIFDPNPALRGSPTASVVPVPVLLPLRESSLAVVPTLLTISDRGVVPDAEVTPAAGVTAAAASPGTPTGVSNGDFLAAAVVVRSDEALTSHGPPAVNRLPEATGRTGALVKAETGTVPTAGSLPTRVGGEASPSPEEVSPAATVSVSTEIPGTPAPAGATETLVAGERPAESEAVVRAGFIDWTRPLDAFLIACGLGLAWGYGYVADRARREQAAAVEPSPATDT
jgi:uncharacterized protein (TIGR03118 family)